MQNTQEKWELAPNGLPVSSAWLFPEYDFATMEPEQYAGVIVERMLERGSWTELCWLLARYGERRGADWVRQHGCRLLSQRSFALWRLVLGIQDYTAPPWAVEAKIGEAW